MAFPVPTYEEIYLQIINDLLTEYEGADTAPGSDGSIWARIEANLIEGPYARISAAERNLHPATADEVALQRFADSFNVVRRATDDDNTFRARVVDAYREPLGSGKESDYIQWALLADDNVAEVYILSNRGGLGSEVRGPGTVDVIVLGSTDRFLGIGDPILDAVRDYIEIERPITADVVVHPASPLSRSVIGTVIATSDEFQFDWQGVPKIVQAGATDTDVELSNILNLEVGSRVVISLEQREIGEINGNIITLTEPLSAAPQPGDGVYPGGPLYEPILAAVQAYFDGLAPLEAIYKSAIVGVIVAVPGVRSVVLGVPVDEETLTPDLGITAPPDMANLAVLGLVAGVI